ncbi:hypothetical protein PICMEDRAFT_81595 [Pichia membranifaciens NRRL Y-2026]|uniref:Secreted protein n=1 Tax=Pichia membranifaciens NRRL Y-2026 TaxID=763406 RepID=A0A1E3NRT0_9ASCO|nr:hypothetical protein PICMEDRAFT_81595 [Pichia membranifaciens NRRL Y-2026]ODQ48398.1 hypothetical protein PICMEDRAFT_81595 [Pichia membranifaciens NRRL Y-2026]
MSCGLRLSFYVCFFSSVSAASLCSLLLGCGSTIDVSTAFMQAEKTLLPEEGRKEQQQQRQGVWQPSRPSTRTFAATPSAESALLCGPADWAC